MLNNILKHNKFATSPASARVNKFPNIRIIKRDSIYNIDMLF